MTVFEIRCVTTLSWKPSFFQIGQVSLEGLLGSFQHRQQLLRCLGIAAFCFMPVHHLPLMDDDQPTCFDMAPSEGAPFL